MELFETDKKPKIELVRTCSQNELPPRQSCKEKWKARGEKRKPRKR